MKTKQLIKGYYKNEQANEDAFDSDGFFRTGDIVEQIGKNKIKIIDR